MPTTDIYTHGDIARILVHRNGILPLRPGDLATVRSTGLRNHTHPYVAVTVELPAGTLHTSFAPHHLEHL